MGTKMYSNILLSIYKNYGTIKIYKIKSDLGSQSYFLFFQNGDGKLEKNPTDSNKKNLKKIPKGEIIDVTPPSKNKRYTKPTEEDENWADLFKDCFKENL